MSVCLVFVFASFEFAVVNVFSRKERRKKSRATLRHKLSPPREEEIALDQVCLQEFRGRPFDSWRGGLLVFCEKKFVQLKIKNK